MLREALARLPVALLVAVALQQIWLVSSAGLTPWCGGGFGMFSTLDSRGARVLRAVALGDGWQEELEIPAALEDAARRAAVLPSDARLDRLARALLPLAADDFASPRALRVEVYTIEFARSDLRPGAVALRALEVPLGEP
jgi:hypothetical protein